MLTIKKYLIIFLALLIVLLCSGCTTNQLNNTTPIITNVTTPGLFENQWVKFNFPTEWQVADGSDSKSLLVQVYQGNLTNDTNLRLAMNFAQTNPENLKNRFPDAQNITIGGSRGIMAKDEFGIYGYAFLEGGPVENTTLVLYCDLNHEDAFNQVKDSLIIKKLPESL